MSLLGLPDELLHSICQDLSAVHPLPAWLNEQIQVERASPALVSLSLTDRRLRQICVPFLFAYLEIRDIESARKFRDFCSVNAVCLQFSRLLTTSILSDGESEASEIVGKLLPFLGRLLCVDLRRSSPSVRFLQLLDQHPTISTVLLSSLPYPHPSSDLWNFLAGSWYIPPESEPPFPGFPGSNFSKVVLISLNLDMSVPQNGFVPDGVKVIKLTLSDPERLDEDFGSYTFDGLCELSLSLPFNDEHISFSWLPAFTATHPYLHTICLSSPKHGSQVPSSISPFFDELARQGLHRHLYINDLYLSRTRIKAWPTLQWTATGISLRCRSRTFEIVLLVESSFSSLENLSIDITGSRYIYSLDDFITPFSQFRCVRVLRLHHIFDRLDFGHELAHNGELHDLNDLELRVDTFNKGLKLCASRLAKAMASLEKLYFAEIGSGYKVLEVGVLHWDLTGWFYVHGASRDIMGRLELRCGNTPFNLI
ncbi:hypothetical protein GYMLUDRAFT_94425 [Collybiopsis luxurians FD-317 M1]|nr:hypothetical protein GYMLUDRAFT_94425 [Collybiopsis luxurians FD-317 M1]